MNIELLTNELVNEDFLERIIYLEQIDSTNKYASKNTSGNDILILTSEQTGGSGRFNKQWHSSPQKNLTFSLVKKFKIGIDEIHIVNFYSSYILFDTLRSSFSKIPQTRVSLKWPNDILVNNKKIAGLLLESKNLNKDEKTFVIGMGLNVNEKDFPESIKNKATSLFLESKEEFKLEEMLIKLIKNFYNSVNLIYDKTSLMKFWSENSLSPGTKINFKKYDDDSELKAVFGCIEPDGAVSLIFENGKKEKFYSGQISILYDS